MAIEYVLPIRNSGGGALIGFAGFSAEEWKSALLDKQAVRGLFVLKVPVMEGKAEFLARAKRTFGVDTLPTEDAE